VTEPNRIFRRSFEGPQGKADLFEVNQTTSDEEAVGGVAGETVYYEVVFNNQTQTIAAIGEATLVAEELVRGG
jgi:hypothetical protein